MWGLGGKLPSQKIWSAPRDAHPSCRGAVPLRQRRRPHPHPTTSVDLPAALPGIWSGLGRGTIHLSSAGSRPELSIYGIVTT
jgi:hypothetical protein